MFLASLIFAGVIFSKNGKGIFLFGVLPVKIFGQCGGAKCGLGFAKTIFWGKDLAKPRLILFLHFVRAEEGSGEESARAFLADKNATIQMF